MRTIKLSELTREQKMGMLLCSHPTLGEHELEETIRLVKAHALGSVWIQHEAPGAQELINRIKEAADYPVLIMCDSEEGVDGHKIPQAISITAAGGREEHAYSFGRATAAAMFKMGFNAVCNPVLDLQRKNSPCGAVTRTFGSDAELAGKLGVAMARGTRDAGLLSVSKHYPGGVTSPYDTHMREGFSTRTRQELLDYDILPYRRLLEAGVLDGVMTMHQLYPKIDPERPASLSRTMLSLLRDCGFDGFYITDALAMMGVTLKYGKYDPVPLSIQAGNDLALPWTLPVDESLDALKDGFARGLLTDADIDAGVAHVLAAQEKVLGLAAAAQPARGEDFANIRAITTDCISAVCDPGLSPTLDAKARHLFVLMTEERTKLDTDVDYTPGPREWYFPQKIANEVRRLFPNSDVMTMPQYPSSNDNIPFLSKQLDYDDLVFVTFAMVRGYTGREVLSSRFVDLMDALQSTNRIAAHLHFGNPFTAATAPHVERVLLGYCSSDCVMHMLKVLHGDDTPRGVIPYDVTFHKKGDIFE